MPENCLAVRVLNLRNGNKVLALQCLVDDTVVTFESAVSPGWICAEKSAVLFLMDCAGSLRGMGGKH